MDFFSKNDAYSFPEIRFCQKRHNNNRNIENWIFSRNDAPRRSQTPLDFFSKKDASSFPGFSGVISFITWYHTLMTSRDLFYMTYSLTNGCGNWCIWRHQSSVMCDIIKERKRNFGFFFPERTLLDIPDLHGIGPIR